MWDWYQTWSFFQSELRQLDIYGCKNNLIDSCHQSKCNILSFKSNQFDLKPETLLIRWLLNLKFGISRFRASTPLPPHPPFNPKDKRKQEFSLQENRLMLLQTINFIKISKHIFKKTRDYNEDMWNKSHSGKFSIFTNILA